MLAATSSSDAPTVSPCSRPPDRLALPAAKGCWLRERSASSGLPEKRGDELEGDERRAFARAERSLTPR